MAKRNRDLKQPGIACPLFNVAIAPETCVETSSVVSTNRQTCLARRCPSKHRQCVHCIVQGYRARDSVVSNPVSGTCLFHGLYGTEANRKDPQVDEPDTDGQTEESVVTGSVVEVDPRRVRPFAEQPRRFFEAAAMASLQESIFRRGQLQPGVVRALSGEQHEFELVDGQRRWTCCRDLDIPFRAVVIQPKDLEDQFEQAIAMNFQREEHTPTEIADAIDRLMSKGQRNAKYCAALFGRSEAWVLSYRRLVSLHPMLGKLLDTYTSRSSSKTRPLPISLACQLAMLPKGQQVEEFKRVSAEGLSSAEAVRQVRKLTEQSDKATPAQRPREIGPQKLHSRVVSLVRRTRGPVDDYAERLAARTDALHFEKTVGVRTVKIMRAEIRSLITSLECLHRALGGDGGQQQKDRSDLV